MFDWSPTQFLLLAVLIAPGFVARSVYRLLVPAPRQDVSSLTVELATYGMINLSLVAWMIPLVLNRRVMDERPLIFGLGTTAMLVIVPVLLGVLTFVVRKSQVGDTMVPAPDAYGLGLSVLAAQGALGAVSPEKRATDWRILRTGIVCFVLPRRC